MNTTKEYRIIEYVKSELYDEPVLNLVSYLLTIARKGIIKKYSSQEASVVGRLFENDYAEYYRAFEVLLKDNIIRSDGEKLYILLWDSTNLYNLKYNFNTRNKRKYSKDPAKGQITIPEYHKDGNVVTMPGISCTSESFKVPAVLSKYLLGQPLTEGERKNLSLEEIFKENERRNLSKEIRRWYLGLMFLSNSRGKINDFNIHFAIDTLNNLFSGSFAESTCYYAHATLVDLGLIEEYQHPKRKTTTMSITGYEEGFGNGKRFVVLPCSLVFDPDFKKYPTRTMNICMDFLFRLNNGENNDSKAPDKEKTIVYKFYKSEFDTDNDKSKYEVTKQKTKRRCSSEIGKLISPLNKYFCIKPNKNSGNMGYFDVRLKEEYFIEKYKANKKERFNDPIERFSKKAGIITDYLQKYNIEFTYKEKQDLVRVLHRASKDIIQRILRTLILDQRIRKERGWKPIESVGAYSYWLYERYKKGDRVLLYEKFYSYYRDGLQAIAEEAKEEELIRMILEGSELEYSLDEYNESLDEYIENYESDGNIA